MEQPTCKAISFKSDEPVIKNNLAVMMNIIEQHGFVGNIWIRQNWMLKAGDTNGGHLHYHDHVTLLVKGSVRVQVENEPYKDFHAPTFIVIKKQYSHRITALEDDTVYYCVFALRDIDGNVMDISQMENMPHYPSENPHFASAAPEGFWGVPTKPEV